MGRPYDWSALELEGDPVPGDTAGIRADARKLKQVAALIIEQARKLKAIAARGEDAWDSDAGQAFLRNASGLAAEIEKAQNRYEVTGLALDRYANELDDVQATADRLLHQAEDAQADLQRAQNTLLPPLDDPGYEFAQRAQGRRLEEAQAALQLAIRGVQNLTGPGGEWTEANRRAAAAINGASDDELKDHWWEGITGAVSGTVQFISDHLDVIKKVLGVISLILAAAVIVALAFAPGGQLLAALLIAAFITAAMDFGATAVLYERGEASGLEMAFATLGLVTGGFGVAAGVKVLGVIAGSGQLGARMGGLAPLVAKTGPFWERAAAAGPVALVNKGLAALERPLNSATSKLGKSLSMANANRVRAAGGDFGGGLRAGYAAIDRRLNGLFGRVAVAVDHSMTGGFVRALLVKSTGSSTRAWGIALRDPFRGTDAVMTGVNVVRAASDGAVKEHQIDDLLRGVRSGATDNSAKLVVGGGW